MRAFRREWAHGAVAIGGAVVLLALVAWLSDVQTTVATLERLAPWQWVVLVATAFGVSWFTALAWRAILAHYGRAVPAWLLFRLTILAFAVGWAVPSGFVAGIPVAAWFLRRHGVPFSIGLASFSIGRFLELTAYGLILPLVLASRLGGHALVQVGAVAVLAAMALVYLDLLLRWHGARRVLRHFRRVVPRAARRGVDAAIGFCRDVARFFRRPWRSVLAATTFSFAAIGVAFVRGVLTNRFLATGLSLPEVAVMFAITIFLMAVPFLPGAIGAYEGGIAGAFEIIGRARSAGLAYALTVHATELAVVVAGLAVLGQLGLGLASRALRAARAGAPLPAPRGSA